MDQHYMQFSAKCIYMNSTQICFYVNKNNKRATKMCFPEQCRVCPSPVQQLLPHLPLLSSLYQEPNAINNTQIIVFRAAVLVRLAGVNLGSIGSCCWGFW